MVVNEIERKLTEQRELVHGSSPEAGIGFEFTLEIVYNHFEKDIDDPEGAIRHLGAGCYSAIEILKKFANHGGYSAEEIRKGIENYLEESPDG
jgi:hypothetical protein